MRSCQNRALENRRSLWGGGQGEPLQALALCMIVMAAMGFSAGVAIAMTDPDWTGTTPTNISQSDTDEARQPAVAVGPSGQIVAVWRDRSQGGSWPNIYAANLSHQQSPELVSETRAKSQLPDVVILDGRVYIAWTDEGSTNESTTFRVYEAELGGSRRLVPIPMADAPSGIATAPRLAVGRDTLHIVFNAVNVEAKGSHIYYSSRDLDNTTWSEASRVHTFPDGSLSWFPALAVNSEEDELHVVWERVSNVGRGVWYSHGSPSGSDVSWTTPRQLSTDNIPSLKPDIAVSSGGDIHVVWGEAGGEKNSYYVRYCRYDPGQKRCSESKRIDTDRVFINQINPTEPSPRLALWETQSEVRLCVTWHGFRTGDAEDALVSCSRDGGETWERPRTMSAFPAAAAEGQDPSIRPSLVFDASGTLHGVWQQRVDIVSAQPYYEIYYARATNCVFLPLVIRHG